MGRKRKRRRGSDSSFPSSSDETSTEATTPPRRSTAESRRKTRKKEDKLIKQMLEELKDDTSKMRKQLKELTESHNKLCKQLELHINGSSGDDSAASRSELNQVQPPRYRLEFTCEMDDSIEKGQIIKTKTHGKMICVAMKDDHDRIVDTGPLASARVKLVVINGEFNQHGSQCNWSRKDFESNIKRPRQGNSVTGDVNQPTESIVKNCLFNLIDGVKSHSDATILYNSGNKKVRLGVMVVSPMEERVLEGLSNAFYVRGHDRPARESSKMLHNGSKRQKQTLVGCGYGELNGPMQNQSWSRLTQLGETIPLQRPGNTTLLPTEPSPRAWTQQDENSHLMMYGTSMAQPAYSLHAGGEQSALLTDFIDLNSPLHNNSTGNDYFPITNGTQFNMDYIVRPVQLVWDRTIVEPRKSWNLLEQSIPLYSCQPKFNNCRLPTMHLMTERFGSLTFIQRDAMQIHRKRGVLIEPFEPDDSDEKGPLKRRFHSKYQLRFVNKACEAYYLIERIKAHDGNHIKVALFDENNTKITSGPLSSASVEVVVLHGDFNADGQDHWTSEDFNHCVACPRPGNAEAILGGDRILILADGEAYLNDVFFRITSFHARTGKFMMGVRLTGVQDERIQEGISEPFRVMECPWQALPPGFRFHPTDLELLHFLRNRATSTPCPGGSIIAEVDIYKFEPWDLPTKAKGGAREWYFFCPPTCCYSVSSERQTEAGYWKATGRDKVILSVAKKIGVMKTLVFYRGRAPSGFMSRWMMHEYRLLDDDSTDSKTASSSTSSSSLQEWVLCRIISSDGVLDTPAHDTLPLPEDIASGSRKCLPESLEVVSAQKGGQAESLVSRCSKKNKVSSGLGNPEAKGSSAQMEDADQNGEVNTSELIGGLGRELSISCLLRLPRSYYYDVACLNRSFYSLIKLGELYRYRQEARIVEQMIYCSCKVLEWDGFDPLRQRWFSIPSMPSIECFTLADKESLAVGTNILVFGRKVEAHVVLTYSLLTNSWKTGAMMNTPRCLFGSASFGEKAIVAGGIGKNCTLRSAELYDSEMETWTTLPSMNRARQMCSGFFMDGKFYVIGGKSERHDILSCAEEFDLEKGTWRMIPDMACGLDHFRGTPPLVAVVNNELYAADYLTKEVRKYDKKNNAWITLGSLPGKYTSGRGLMAFHSCGDMLIVIGGMSIADSGLIEICSWVPNDGLPDWKIIGSHPGRFVYNCAVMGC